MYDVRTPESVWPVAATAAAAAAAVAVDVPAADKEGLLATTAGAAAAAGLSVEAITGLAAASFRRLGGRPCSRWRTPSSWCSLMTSFMLIPGLARLMLLLPVVVVVAKDGPETALLQFSLKSTLDEASTELSSVIFASETVISKRSPWLPLSSKATSGTGPSSALDLLGACCSP